MRVLGPGWHLFETIGTSVHKAALSGDSITHGMVSILRILPGEVGLGLLNGKAILLATGRHLINDPLFIYKGRSELTKEHIEVGTAHVITVAAGRCVRACGRAGATAVQQSVRLANRSGERGPQSPLRGWYALTHLALAPHMHARATRTNKCSTAAAAAAAVFVHTPLV